jgi:hypothetical protein
MDTALYCLASFAIGNVSMACLIALLRLLAANGDQP